MNQSPGRSRTAVGTIKGKRSGARTIANADSAHAIAAVVIANSRNGPCAAI